MKASFIKNISRLAMGIAVAGVALGMVSCKDDQYTSRGDLFQPRFATDPAVTVTNNNDISIIWYQVNDAVGYTVQIFEDVYYQNLYKQFELTTPYLTLEDIPYGTRYYVRVRSNAPDPANNSQWALCNFTTLTRPPYAQIVQGVSKSEITDNGVTIHWLVDNENPADSFSVVPAIATTLPSFSGYLTEEQKASGTLELNELTPSTLYTVNIYDTSKPRQTDKPYNTVNFRTTGPAPAVIEIGLTDNLSDILTTNNDNPDIPEGTEYMIPEGSTYTISPFAIKKGFRLVGPTEGSMPVIIMNGTWSVYNGAQLATLAFENIELRNQLANQYFFNSGNSFSVENVSFTNCVLRNIMRGFWRHQNSNIKHIQEFEIDGCWFDQCGWQGSTYGTFYFGSAGKNEIGAYDQIDNLTIRNCTFSRGGYTQDTSWGWTNLVSHSMSSCPINLTVENVTFYDYCVNGRLIDISNTERSTVSVRNVIIAAPMGELLANGSGTRTNFSNNYITTDYVLGGAQISATSLGIPAAMLFQNPEGGDYTIKDHSSMAYLTQAGDLRWIK